MQVNKSFRSSLFFMILVIILFILGSLAVTAILARNSRKPLPQPNVLIAKMVNRLNPHDPRAAVEEFNRLVAGSLPFHAYLYDQAGNPLYPPGGKKMSDWESKKLPAKPFEEENLNSRGASLLIPIPDVTDTIVRIPSEPPTFLILRDNSGNPAPPVFLLVTLAILLISIFLGVTLSLYFIFRVIRLNLMNVDEVMERLKSGDLKARVKIRKMDEVGSVLSRFNLMADDIELLVEKLRRTERSRTSLLQELAHDLRTPVASLKSLLSNLQASEGRLPPQTVIEVFDLCFAEVSYFERLVEDLLFLAQMSDPSYRVQPEPLKLADVIESVIEEFRASQEEIDLELSEMPTGLGAFSGSGDAHLLKRFFKNAIGNAVSFAKSSVKIEISYAGASAKVRIVDDGPGFSPEAIKSFGERKATRVVDKRQKNRVSIGLGSVIMKQIAELHRGSVVPGNVVGASGAVLGGVVELDLPAKS